MGRNRPLEAGSSAGANRVGRLRAEGRVALVGSAVSMWEPCDLPPGKEVTDSLASLYAFQRCQPLWRIEKLLDLLFERREWQRPDDNNSVNSISGAAANHE